MNENKLPEDIWAETDPVDDMPTPPQPPIPTPPTPPTAPSEPETQTSDFSPTPEPVRMADPVYAPTPAQTLDLANNTPQPRKTNSLRWIWGGLVAVVLLVGGVYAWQTIATQSPT